MCKPFYFTPTFETLPASNVNDKFIGKKEIIPDNTISYISFDLEDEAHYVCAILNSSSVLTLFSHRSTKSKWGISISMVKNLPIPKYDRDNNIHKEISDLSKQAHELTKDGKDTSDLEKKIDMFVEKIIVHGKK